MTTPRLTIGAFSRLCRLTVVTLRHYDRVGLLMPAEVDAATGYRYYRAEQVATALQIGLLRSLGVSITDLRSFVNGRASLDDLLAGQRLRLTAQLHERQRMIDVIDALSAGAVAPYEIAYGIEPERRAAGLTIDTSWARVESATRHALTRVAVLLRRAGVGLGAMTGALFPITPSERMTVTVFGAVDDDADADASLVQVALPGADALSTVHRGDPRLLGYAYHALLGEVAVRGLEAVGPAREYYLDTGGESASCTRLVIPTRAHRRE